MKIRKSSAHGRMKDGRRKATLKLYLGTGDSICYVLFIINIVEKNTVWPKLRSQNERKYIARSISSVR